MNYSFLKSRFRFFQITNNYNCRYLSIIWFCLHSVLRRGLRIMAVSVINSPMSYPYNSLKKPSTSGFAFCNFYKETPPPIEIRYNGYSTIFLKFNIHDYYIKAITKQQIVPQKIFSMIEESVSVSKGSCPAW